MAVTALHLIIHGRVQGVGYRAWTGAAARQHGVRGWVRNRTEGTVEALFVGEEEVVQRMVTACHAGPMGARVTQVDASIWEGEHPSDFRSLPTV